MVRALVLLHRWLGIGVCVLFAMWFASGIVMHLVPFPSLTDAARIAGLAPIDVSRVRHAAGEALAASGLAGIDHMRLVQRADGPVYVLTGSSQMKAVRAVDLSDARVASDDIALELASAHAHQRGLDATRIDLVMHDQWIVPNGYDPHRPLYRVAMNDLAGTELYVSSASGEIVLDTTRFARGWNYVGSVVHWIYPTKLRSHWATWDRIVWTVSLIAFVAAITGVALGLVRLRRTPHGLRSPFRGWHAWHHVLGLICATFVVTWIFSGWLSMDHGRLFSRGELSDTERSALKPALDADRLSRDAQRLSPGILEVEWFTLGDQIYRRDRTSPASQNLHAIDATRSLAFLTPDDIAAATARVAPDCDMPIVVRSGDSYPAASIMAAAPAYRAICGDVWFHIDGATGAVIERLDRSRRTYRWAYTALHTLNIPQLADHPGLRSGLIIGLCLAGFAFSLTGVVIGWRRLRRHFAVPGA